MTLTGWMSITGGDHYTIWIALFCVINYFASEVQHRRNEIVKNAGKNLIKLIK